jgi:hypothetical protein
MAARWLDADLPAAERLANLVDDIGADPAAAKPVLLAQIAALEDRLGLTPGDRAPARPGPPPHGADGHRRSCWPMIGVTSRETPPRMETGLPVPGSRPAQCPQRDSLPAIPLPERDPGRVRGYAVHGRRDGFGAGRSTRSGAGRPSST